MDRGEKMKIEREVVKTRWTRERKTVEMPERSVVLPETTYGSNCCRTGGAAAVAGVAIECDNV